MTSNANGDIFRGVGVEVTLDQRDDFLKVCETLERIGTPDEGERKLTQVCHILHKRGRYAIVHFMEMFKLDGAPVSVTTDQQAVRNTIAELLDEWGLVRIVTEDDLEPTAPMSAIKILKHAERKEWTLESRYKIGKRKRSDRTQASLSGQ